MDPGTALMIGSSVVQGFGAIEQSQASAASAGYNAKIAAQNAQLATQNAQFAGGQGEQNVGAEALKTKSQVSAITANQGASGVDVNTGSNVNVKQSAAEIGMLNALNIRSQAAQSAYGFQTQAVSDTAQSQLYRSQQSADKTAGYVNAFGDVLGGVGKAAAYTSWLNQSSPTGNLTGIPDIPQGGYGPSQLPWLNQVGAGGG